MKIVDDDGNVWENEGKLEMILNGDMDKGELQKFMKQFIENIGKSERKKVSTRQRPI